jgi:hypothetical protein
MGAWGENITLHNFLPIGIMMCVMIPRLEIVLLTPVLSASWGTLKQKPTKPEGERDRTRRKMDTEIGAQRSRGFPEDIGWGGVVLSSRCWTVLCPSPHTLSLFLLPERSHGCVTVTGWLSPVVREKSLKSVLHFMHESRAAWIGIETLPPASSEGSIVVVYLHLRMPLHFDVCKSSWCSLQWAQTEPPMLWQVHMIFELNIFPKLPILQMPLAL